MKTLEIYFSDLNEEAQKEVLNLYDMKDESASNFEYIPLFYLDYSPDEEEDE